MTDPAAISPEQARAALAWWMLAGIDAPVADEARSWLKASGTADVFRGAASVAMVDARPQNTLAVPDSLPDAALDTLAHDAQTLPALLAAARAHAGPGALLFDGAPASGLLFVTDAPASDDEREGRLLTGPAGALLDRMLAAIGLDRSRVGLATAALRIGGDADEVAFLRRLIALEPPRLIVTLGGPATVRLTNTTHSLNRLRGKWIDTSIDAVMFPVLPTFHPAHLLAHPAHKALAWADLQGLARRIAA